jgi:hypothetical protein
LLVEVVLILEVLVLVDTGLLLQVNLPVEGLRQNLQYLSS